MKTAAKAKIGVAILAAGGSSRLGRPKQLVPLRDIPLLRHLCLQALASQADRVMVALGSHAKEIEPALHGLRVSIRHNDQWRQGLSSSVQLAVAWASALKPPLDGLLFLASDQPHVTSELMDRMLEVRAASGKSIVACSYAGTTGVPALFASVHFEELARLRGDRGAKSVILSHSSEVVSVAFPEGAIDIDSQEDLERFLGS